MEFYKFKWIHFYGLWIFSLHWKALHKQITEEFTHILVLFVWFHFLHVDPGSIWNLFLCVPSGIDLIFSLSKWQNQTSQQNLFNSYSFLNSFEMATSSHNDEIGSSTCIFIYFWNSISLFIHTTYGLNNRVFTVCFIFLFFFIEG